MSDGPTPSSEAWVDLSNYTTGSYTPGRGIVTQMLWYAVSLLFFESGLLPASGPKRTLLRWFGSKVGQNVTIKPNVRIKFPWRLSIGDHVWLGQESWIDNLAEVTIGSHVCLSQRAYLCTGSHDPTKKGFDLLTGEIRLEDGCWVAAGATVLGGVTIGANAIVAAGCVVNRSVEPAKIVGGIPARELANRPPAT